MFFHLNQKHKQSCWWLAEGSNENSCFLHKVCHALQIVQVAEKLPPLARADVQGCVKKWNQHSLVSGLYSVHFTIVYCTRHPLWPLWSALTVPVPATMWTPVALDSLWRNPTSRWSPMVEFSTIPWPPRSWTDKNKQKVSNTKCLFFRC